MAARATTGDIPMRAENVGSARLAGERPCDCSAITVITAARAEPWNPHVNEARLERPQRLVRAAAYTSSASPLT